MSVFWTGESHWQQFLRKFMGYGKGHLMKKPPGIKVKLRRQRRLEEGQLQSWGHSLPEVAERTERWLLYQYWGAGVSAWGGLAKGWSGEGAKGSHLCRPQPSHSELWRLNFFLFVFPQAWLAMLYSLVTLWSRGTLSVQLQSLIRAVPILLQPSFLGRKWDCHQVNLTVTSLCGPATFSDTAFCLLPIGSFHCI